MTLRSLLCLALLSAACGTTTVPLPVEPPALSPREFATELVPEPPDPGEFRANHFVETPESPLELPRMDLPTIAEPLSADHSVALPSGLFNPMPGGYLAGYSADTGLDIAGLHQTVYAIAAGTLDYAEGGHTLWNGRRDDPFAIRIELDEPITIGKHRVTHVWYAHLSKMDFELKDGAKPRIHVEAGQRLGVSGLARGSPHLHLGMLLDGQVEQEWGTFLGESDVRAVLGHFANKTRLPKS